VNTIGIGLAGWGFITLDDLYSYPSGCLWFVCDLDAVRGRGFVRCRQAFERCAKAVVGGPATRSIRWGLSGEISIFHKTKHGQLVLGDSLAYMSHLKPASVDLIVTSPPFGLVRKKDYGNVESHDYVDWFKPFGREFTRILKPSGSLVVDIGGAWIPGQPTRSLYHFELAIMLCREMGFYLAQEFPL